MSIPRPLPMADPRTDVEPRLFQGPTIDGEYTPGIHFEGFGPKHGDIVERYGVLTYYQWYRGDDLPNVPDHARNGLFAAIHESGHVIAVAANENGGGSRVVHGDFAPDGTRRQPYAPFPFDDHELAWRHEIVRDVDSDGREYDWEAMVCVPTSAPNPSPIWSLRYREESERKHRVSASTARHARRVRVEEATVERFDPLEVYERDGWCCGLCQQVVDRDLAWPDPMSPSLDHVIPLIGGGEHSRANTQLAHWICNVRKGARYLNGSEPGASG